MKFLNNITRPSQKKKKKKHNTVSTDRYPNHEMYTWRDRILFHVYWEIIFVPPSPNIKFLAATVNRYVSWLLVAAVYHLPSSHSVAMSMRMNLSLFLTTFASSILCLLAFHCIFKDIQYIFQCDETRQLPDIWTILQFSAVSPDEDPFWYLYYILSSYRSFHLPMNSE